jgi:DNA-binding NarL/FixJ family response regulator
MLRILIADDHVITRRGLKDVLTEEFPQAEFGATRASSETLLVLLTQPWHLLVLSFFTLDSSGLKVLRQVREHSPHLPALVLGGAPEEELAVRTLKAGAQGYLNLQADPKHLVEAMRIILSGKNYVSQTLGARLAADAVRADRPPHESLSDREFEILKLVVQGRSLKEIASDLSLNVKTVRTFHRRLLAKLQLQNDVELVHYAIRHQLLAPKPQARGAENAA